MGTITKALEMLNFFSRTRAEIGLSEFVRLSGREKATVHRHLLELEQNGFLEKDAVSRAYRLGPAILRLSSVREATHPVRQLVRPIVSRLADDVGELAHVSVLQGTQLSHVFFDDPKRHGTQVSFDESEMLPLHATASGQAILAFSRDDFVSEVLENPMQRFTDKTITKRDSIETVLNRARRSGFGLAEQSFDSEVTSQAVALFDAAAEPAGAISISMPVIRASQEKMNALRPKLVDAAIAATRSLGGQFPKHHPLHAIASSVSHPS